jgi:hypothetical protein
MGLDSLLPHGRINCRTLVVLLRLLRCCRTLASRWIVDSLGHLLLHVAILTATRLRARCILLLVLLKDLALNRPRMRLLVLLHLILLVCLESASRGVCEHLIGLLILHVDILLNLAELLLHLLIVLLDLRRIILRGWIY